MTQIHSHEVELGTALDFVNTAGLSDGRPHDDLPTLDAALAWLSDRGILHEDGSRTVDGSALDRVIRARAALRELADSAYERRSPGAAAVDEVNRVLRARETLQLVTDEHGLRLDHRHDADPIDEALARLAEPIVLEVASGRPDRLRACANDECRWVFFDASPTGRRRWCDMASCGNRAKAARHRARTKARSGAGPSTPRVSAAGAGARTADGDRDPGRAG